MDLKGRPVPYLVEALADVAQIERGPPVSLLNGQGLKSLPRLRAVHALSCMSSVKQEQETVTGCGCVQR